MGRRTFSISGMALALLAITMSSACAEEWGSIKGRFVWAPTELPLGAVLDVNKDKDWCLGAGPLRDQKWIVDPETKGVRNIFCYLAKPSAIHPDYPQDAQAANEAFRKEFEQLNGFAFGNAPMLVSQKKIKLRDIKSPAAMIDQVRCLYVPHAVAIRQGHPSLVLNPEPIAHNVKVASISGANDANPIMPPGTIQVFDWRAERNPMRVECSIHGWMNLYAMVFDHPYFVVTGKDGSFELKNVPAGEVTLMLRNPIYLTVGGKVGARGKKERENKVVVKSGETTDLGLIELRPKK